jgi:hypothetical protein
MVDLATLFGHFDGAPNLEWLELANRHLAGVLESRPTNAPLPHVRLFRVGTDGVDVWLDRSLAWAPEPWMVHDDGRVWHLSTRLEPSSLPADALSHRPLVPAVVPVGDDDRGTWLAAVGPGSCLPVLGAEAQTLVDTMRLTAESWPWSEDLLITDDADTTTRLLSSGTSQDVLIDRSPVDERRTVDDGRPTVLFLGDPRLLEQSVRAQCGVITTLPVPATDLTLAVDARAISIHPLGVTLRPHLLRPHLLDPASRLFDRWAAGEPDPASDDANTDPSRVEPQPPDGPDSYRNGVPATAHRSRSATSADHEDEAEHNDEGPQATLDEREARPTLGPGPVEVRLLVPVPRIDGLAEPLSAKRARRATELIAYLALHHPTPITSDRLRTRVLGSPDADAAAKTLFNVATAARRALGTDRAGDPYFPPALKTGHYRISDLVTVDATRAARLIGAAREAPDAEEALALYRAALELVEGEPLSGALSGYSWWQSEGHAGRARSLVLQAACGIATTATDAEGGQFAELVEWALDQARAVDPYSEELSRVAMRWAAASGNEDRLRREWIDCQRMVDELDPGSVPSERTEALYAELTRRTAAPSPTRQSGS